MRFSPVTEAKDDDRHNRWFPTHSASMASLRASPLPRHSAQQDSDMTRLGLSEPGGTLEDLDSRSHRWPLGCPCGYRFMAIIDHVL